MASNTPSQLKSAVVRILRPLVRLLLRNNISAGEFTELARWCYVDVADRAFKIKGRKQTTSRLALLTGLTRKEVKRLKETDLRADDTESSRYNRLARLIGGWMRDQRFHDQTGRPADLAVEGGGSSFDDLVRRYSGDIPCRAVLDELTRTGVVSLDEQGRVRLLVHGYIPGGDEPAKIAILGVDVAHLIRTIDHNIGRDSEPFMQRKVAYDNIPAASLPELRQLGAVKGQEFLEQLDRALAEHDRDISGAPEEGARYGVGIGVYYFEEKIVVDSKDERGGNP